MQAQRVEGGTWIENCSSGSSAAPCRCGISSVAFPSGVDGGTQGSASASRSSKKWQDGDPMKQLHGPKASGSTAVPAAAANMPLAGCSRAAGGRTEQGGAPARRAQDDAAAWASGGTCNQHPLSAGSCPGHWERSSAAGLIYHRYRRYQRPRRTCPGTWQSRQ